MTTWNEFKTALQQHPTLELQFEYGTGKHVNAAYHITEIKQAPITAVDCGGVMNRWTEVIVQLWEPEGQQQERAMTAEKALTIIAVVDKVMALAGDAIVKIEFGNAAFDTRQMLPNNISVVNGQLLVNLRADTVQCKAQDRGGSCGTTPTGEECCEPTKPKFKMVNLTNNPAASCTPGGGCC